MFFPQREIDSFWDTLAPHWNRRPVLIKQPFSTPFVDESEFLSFLHQWGEDAREGRRSVAVHLLDADVLPRRDDRTLADFEARIAARWPRDWYLYVSDGIQQHNGSLWERAIELIRPAMRVQGGLPSGGMTIEVFYGKYAATPTGIHLDSSDNLAFVTRGPKRLLFWPPGRFAAKLASPPQMPRHQQALTGRYDDYLEDATIIDGEAGDVIYWPKDYWHVGASGAGWSGMITVPMWWSASPATLAQAMLPRVLDLRAEPQPYSMDIDDLASAASEMPAPLGEMVSQVKSQVSLKLEPAARIAWAKFVTAYGFSTPPAPKAAPELTADTRLRVAHPIVAIPLGTTAAVVACGHHVLARGPALAAVAGDLRVGSEHTVADLAARLPAGDAEASRQLPRLLADLASFRALDVTTP